MKIKINWQDKVQTIDLKPNVPNIPTSKDGSTRHEYLLKNGRLYFFSEFVSGEARRFEEFRAVTLNNQFPDWNLILTRVEV